jgi:hypothetical protein
VSQLVLIRESEEREKREKRRKERGRERARGRTDAAVKRFVLARREGGPLEGG